MSKVKTIGLFLILSVSLIGAAAAVEMSPEYAVSTRGYCIAPDLALQGGKAWIAWTRMDPDTRHYSVYLTSYANGRIEMPQQVAQTDAKAPDAAIEVDGSGLVWVVWPEIKEGGECNLFAVSVKAGKASEKMQLTKDGKSFNPQLAVGKDGALWLVYQSKRDGNYKVYARAQRDGKWSEDAVISDNRSSNRKPSVGVDANNCVWVAWDTFRNGNYDVYVRGSEAGGAKWMEPIRLTDLMRHDMTTSLAIDDAGQVWTAWVRSDPYTRFNYRLNTTKQLMVRGYRPEESIFVRPAVKHADDTGEVPVPVDPRGRELPITPTLVTDAKGALHVLFRQYRNEGSNDWGWMAKMMTCSGEGWSEPVTISSAPGLPISEIAGAIAEDGSLYVVYESCVYPGGRKPLKADTSNILMRVIKTGETAKPQVRRAAMPNPKHMREYDVERPDPSAKPTLASGDKKYQLMWGEMHSHSTISKCVPVWDGTLWDHYRFAEDEEQLDFYMNTEHTDQISDFEADRSWTWADLFNDPDGFTTIYAAEQNFSGVEHTNWLALDRASAWFMRRARQQTSDLTEAYSILDQGKKQGKVQAIRHFHGDGFGIIENPPAVNPTYERVMEAIQVRGFSPDTVNRYLQRGAKLGFVAGPDHARRPGGSGGLWVYPYVLSGVYAEANTREAIWQAIEDRRGFVTNGKKMVVTMRCGDHLMGEEITTGDAPALMVDAKGTSPITMIEIIRNGKTLAIKKGLEDTMRFQYQDRTAKVGESYYYYARVVQEREDGDNYSGEAWTSPVWVTMK